MEKERIPIYIEPKLKKALKRASKNDSRSMNSYIIEAIKEKIERDKKD